MSELTAAASFPALGGIATVVVTDPARLRRAREVVEETVACFDQACSSHRSDSELRALNGAAGAEVRVGWLLWEAVSVALRGARLTDGDVDPTVGGALLASTRAQVAIARVPGWRAVAIDQSRRTVRLPAGVQLDLGATAKALAADRAASAASRAARCGALVSLSGDLSTCGAPPAGGWRVRVTDDHRSDEGAPGQWVTIRAGGLATSSTTVRRWKDQAGEAHHVIDPATGAPAEVIWRTASVTARSCVDANIASTATIVRGEQAVEWLEALALPSRLVSAAGRAQHIAGWPSEGDDLA